MAQWRVPFDARALVAVASSSARTTSPQATPFWVYDGDAVLRSAARLAALFDGVRYAQKANSSLALLRLLRTVPRVVLDAVSAGEIARAVAVGCCDSVASPRAASAAASGASGDAPPPPPLMYTADVFDEEALALIAAHRVPVNIGSADMLEQLARAGVRVPITVRVNPGFGHGHSSKVTTGGPWSKHGVYHTELRATIERAHALGFVVDGLHMHIGSGCDMAHLAQVADAMVDAVRESALGAELQCISAGGGLPVDYRAPEQVDEYFDVGRYFTIWDAARKRIEELVGHAVRLEVEPGRYLVAAAGYLIARVRAVKQVGDNRFALLDAGFNDLVRPAMYGAYHHISLASPAPGAPAVDARPLVPHVIAGPLCESGDVFSYDRASPEAAETSVQPRVLPELHVDDLVCLHHAGAYGASMSSNYNSRPLAAEVLLHGGRATLVRRRQPLEDVFRYDV